MSWHVTFSVFIINLYLWLKVITFRHIYKTLVIKSTTNHLRNLVFTWLKVYIYKFLLVFIIHLKQRLQQMIFLKVYIHQQYMQSFSLWSTIERKIKIKVLKNWKSISKTNSNKAMQNHSKLTERVRRKKT